jgi:SAM-dependent methyltransferase
VVRHAFDKGTYGIWDCSACDHRFTPVTSGAAHVSQVYGDDYFTGGGAGYPDYVAEGEILKGHGRRYGEILLKHAAPGRLLDVGAAAGFVLRGLMDTGWTGVGVEPNASMAEHAREVVGVEVRTGTLEDLPIDETFDAVTMVQVIAHFYDIERALQTAARATKPGGLWLIEGWDRSSLPARTLGSAWHEYSPPSVVHWFTPDSLERLAKRHGFEEVERGRPKKSIAFRHAKSLLDHSLGKLSRVLPTRFVPDDFVVPYPALDVFYGIFRRGESRS